jgi:Ran GTPase-activating protein (RanGAP) involved in mRNA processing and transport
MSLLLSITSLLGLTVPSWLEETNEKLASNDPTYKTVDLTHPRIDDVSAKIFASALDENNVVETVILSCFEMVDDGASAIGTVLGKSKNIRKLQLKDLRNVREITTFFQLLEQNTNLMELSLRHCTICPRGAVAIARFLKQHPKLQEFRLTDSQLTETSLQILCQQGMKCSNTVRRCYLINDELVGSESAAFLADVFSGNPLQELHLGENELGDEGVAVLASGILSRGTSLRYLDLRANGITEAGAMSLQGLLVSSQNLIGLNLSNNELGDLGTTALTRGIRSSACKLQKIDLSSNQIEHRGATAIASMLQTNQKLEELILSFNAIGDEGAIAIGQSLRRNRKLRLLALRKNGITDEGAKIIAETLPSMLGLKELLLSKNIIGRDGASALLVGLRSNTELEYLQVEEKLSEPVHREIVHWVRLNKAGRRVFLQTNSIPLPLWSHVYGRISHDPNVVRYYFKTLCPLPIQTSTLLTFCLLRIFSSFTLYEKSLI